MLVVGPKNKKKRRPNRYCCAAKEQKCELEELGRAPGEIERELDYSWGG